MNDLRSRLCLLRSVFRQGSGLTLTALAQKAGVSSILLMPGYKKTLQPETLQRIGEAAEELVHRADLDGGRLTAWLQGAAVGAVEETLQKLLEQKLCSACQEWLPMSVYYTAAQPRCKACTRAARTPKGQPVLQLIKSLLPAAAREDQALAEAVAVVVEGCERESRTFSSRRVAAVLGCGERRASERLEKVGLSRSYLAKLVQFVALLTALTGTSWATSVRMGRTRELVLRVQRRGSLTRRGSSSPCTNMIA